MNHHTLIALACASACAFTSTIFAEDAVDPISIYPTAANTSSLSQLANMMPKTSDEAEQLVDTLLSFARDQKAKFLAIEQQNRTFLNTVRAFDSFSGVFSYRACQLSSFKSLSDEMDVAEGEAMDRRTKPIARLSQESSDLFMDRDIYNAFVAYRDNRFQEEKASLTEEELEFFEETMKDFARSGFELGDEQFKQLTALQQELSKLSLAFSSAIAADDSHLMVAKQHLLDTGVSPDFIEGCEVRTNEDGVEECKVVVNAPGLFAIMRYCSDGELRKRFIQAWNRRGYPANKETLSQVLKKRKQLAEMLGYTSYAEMTLESMMIGSEEGARKFLADLREPAWSKALKEHAFFTQEQSLPDGVSLTDDGRIAKWDDEYVTTMYEKTLGVDDNEVSKYFPMSSTVQGVFDIYQKFMGVSFDFHSSLSDEDRGGWHPDTQAITVRTKDRSRVIGHILLDLYPRPGKYTHFCFGPLGVALNGGYYCPETETWEHPITFGVVIGNFPAPVGGKDPLLKHRDVQTFFHEFGHAMHHMFGQSGFFETSGTQVKFDFVELPSQILEEWLWDTEVVQGLSSYYQDEPDGSRKKGDMIPAEMVEHMVALDRVKGGKFLSRQLSLSQLCLDFYDDSDEKNPEDLQKIMRRVARDYRPDLMFDDEDHHYASFGHLMGYGARYYGYMYSRAYAEDVLQKIIDIGNARGENGLLGEYEVAEDGTPLSGGACFVNHILRPAGSKHPSQLLRNMLGREPSVKAFCKKMLGEE